MLLAIDTATAWCGVALYDGALRLELNWRADRHHSEQLMHSIERGLDLTGLDRVALRALGVSRGPGSYTGVRVGITIARVLSYALDIPIIGVDALDVVAYEHADRGLPVRPFLDAGRRRYASALYEPRFDGLKRVGALQSVDEDSMAGLLRGPTMCCGELSSTAR
ncbi:MAG TPA: tRNA (adenosine(37)-N6)-threonylcarbamoyltransferase complex dimerization subunit type 1 TsaB, partial [Chloroflexota bacterium]|nr:tRNA (adenosine(37)-N6)-threonylcarbamoyltransferase complex dimerization subunit type 1 TsaB [Chloroflexota bacterium]